MNGGDIVTAEAAAVVARKRRRVNLFVEVICSSFG
jgi:hypothetical protein